MVKTKQNKKRGGEEFQDLELREIQELINRRRLDGEAQRGEGLAQDYTAGKEVADKWYSEIKNYNSQQPGFASGTGHFTIMEWKNTKKMGMRKASASDGSSFMVAGYFPEGNVIKQGFFEENVLPPKK
ncbi:Golgi-associated plant pathogenesis-related protein 1-like [Panthera uncia]|uniref:Golgi-associated plant pathogenesis-related protein 1-like n=1 Tax=Panthera uncia TaxID=29064 RepID=UPI0020FF9D02|nr:Golgi-associated plant pathogenesis-related protein 1-like [Panthera uncia]